MDSEPVVSIPLEIAYILAGLLPDDIQDHNAVVAFHEAIKRADPKGEPHGEDHLPTLDR